MAAVGSRGQGSAIPRDGISLQRSLIVPGHPVAGAQREFGRVLVQLGQVVEGIDAVQLTGVDQAREQIPDTGAIFGLVEVGILAVQNRLFQGLFTDVVHLGRQIHLV